MQISSQQTSSLKPIIFGPQVNNPSSLAHKSPAEIASATSSLASSHRSPITGSASQSAPATRSVSPPPPESSPSISYSTSATGSSAALATTSSAAVSPAAIASAAIASAAISFSATTISLRSPLPASSKTPPPPPIITSPIPPSDDEDFFTGLISPTSNTAALDVEAHIKTPFSIKNKIKELSQRQFEEEEEMIAFSQRMKLF